MGVTDLKPKVMYVEDDQDVATVALMSMKMIGGLDATHFRSGLEALEALSTLQPDLILLDVMMPEMDGVTLFKHIQNRPEGQGVPIVFMTARVQHAEVQSYLELGATDVIGKPFDPRKLCDRLKQIITESSGLL